MNRYAAVRGFGRDTSAVRGKRVERDLVRRVLGLARPYRAQLVGFVVAVVLAAIVSALVIMLAMHTTITERTREIGILKAMGASRFYIISEIEREALLISFIGLLVGFALAAGAGFGIHKATSLIFEFSPRWALTAAAIGLLGGALGAFYPAARAANLDPVNALAYE